MRTNGGFLQVLSDNHLQFLPLPQVASVLLVFAGLLAGFVLFILSLRRYQALSMIVVPASFVYLSLALSAAISLGSLIGGYEILNRQWLASLILVPVGAIWLVGNLVKLIDSKSLLLGRSVTAVVVIVLAAMSLYRLNGQSQALRGYAEIARDYQNKWAGTTAEDAPNLFEEMGWETANINIYLGGPVWPVTKS
jgi:hypothetical protein